jgi:predicted HAD superfamily Cof-like phosphohydrolase
MRILWHGVCVAVGMNGQSAAGDGGVVPNLPLTSGAPVARTALTRALAGWLRSCLGRKIFARRSGHDPLTAESRPSQAAMSVATFHAAFGLPLQNAPTRDVPDALAVLRVQLLAEEAEEFKAAAQAGDLIAVADALADVVYVAYGSAVTYGIDLDAVLAEVHRSNMSKLDADGRPLLREDGKVLKSSRYTPPDVAGVLRHQRPLPW